MRTSNSTKFWILKDDSIENYAYMLIVGIVFLMLSSLEPYFLGLGLIITCGTLFLIIIDFYERKYVNIWKLLGVVTKDGKTPRCICKVQHPTYQERIYSIPNGLSCKQVLSRKEEIENIFKCNIDISLMHSYNVKITIPSQNNSSERK